MANLKAIYGAPKGDCIIHLEQMEDDVLKTLKGQLFNIFLTEHPNDLLQQNGFPLPAPEQDLSSILKNRREPLYTVYDIYNIGLSIFEKIIPKRLASDILSVSSKSSTTSSQVQERSVIDTNSKEIIELLHKILDENKMIRKENKKLYEHVESLEKKVDSLKGNQQHQQPNQVLSNVPLENQPPPNQIQTAILPLDTQPPKNRAQDRIQRPMVTSNSTRESAPKTSKSTNTKTNVSGEYQSYKSALIYGERAAPPNKKIVGTTKPYSLFVGGLNPQMTLKDIKETVQNQVGIRVIKVVSNKMNNFNQSVRLDIDVKDKVTALLPETWFQGIIVKPFKQSRMHKGNESSNRNTTGRYDNRKDNHYHTNYFNDEYNYFNDEHNLMNDQYNDNRFNGYDRT